MSTTATPAAGAAADTTAAATAEKPKITSVPADIRRRAMGLDRQTPEERAAEAKAKADKLAADALAAKAAEDKKLADEAAAKATGGAPAVGADQKVKKVKAGPALPDAPAADAKTIADQVRDALAQDKSEADRAARAAPAVNPEIEREIELAKFAAKKHPDRYAAQPEKIAGFYASRDQLLAEKAKEFGGQNSEEFKDYVKSEEFRDWVTVNRPSYARGDVAKLQEDMIADRVRSETRAEMAPELKALERKTAELQHAPEINARTQAALGIIITDPNPEKDPAMAGFAADPTKFGAEHPEEARLIASEAADAVEQIREVYRIDRDLVEFDPRRPTARQAQIKDFMVRRNEELKAKFPTGFETADGKILVDADTFRERGLHKDARYRTFNADEIAGMIAATANAEVLSKLRQRREGVAKSIYAPKTATPPPKQDAEAAAKAAEEVASPDAVVSRSSGAKGKPVDDAWKKAKDRYLNGKK